MGFAKIGVQVRRKWRNGVPVAESVSESVKIENINIAVGKKRTKKLRPLERSTRLICGVVAPREGTVVCLLSCG